MLLYFSSSKSEDDEHYKANIIVDMLCGRSRTEKTKERGHEEESSKAIACNKE